MWAIRLNTIQPTMRTGLKIFNNHWDRVIHIYTIISRSSQDDSVYFLISTCNLEVLTYTAIMVYEIT